MRYSMIYCGVLLFALCIANHGQAVSQDSMDRLELCQILSHEERDILKRYPVICDAFGVVNGMSRDPKQRFLVLVIPAHSRTSRTLCWEIGTSDTV